MTAELSPLRLLLVTPAGWVNRHQQQIIEYLVEENHVLTEQLKGRRVRLTDDQRRRVLFRWFSRRHRSGAGGEDSKGEVGSKRDRASCFRSLEM